jgi:hypothetical protein
VEVFPDVTDGGHLYLHKGWIHFACTLDLRDGYSLVLRYDGQSHINIKVFDITNCRKQCSHNFEAGGNQLSLPIAEPRSFAMIMKKYHLKVKYLVSTRVSRRTYLRCRKLPLSSLSSVFLLCEAKNMLVDIERAHDYKQWRMVELQMAGLSWFVGLERTLKNKVLRVLFKYRWGAFCADNNLNIGNTCFFSVIH